MSLCVCVCMQFLFNPRWNCGMASSYVQCWATGMTRQCSRGTLSQHSLLLLHFQPLTQRPCRSDRLRKSIHARLLCVVYPSQALKGRQNQSRSVVRNKPSFFIYLLLLFYLIILFLRSELNDLFITHTLHTISYIVLPVFFSRCFEKWGK